MLRFSQEQCSKVNFQEKKKLKTKLVRPILTGLKAYLRQFRWNIWLQGSFLQFSAISSRQMMQTLSPCASSSGVASGYIVFMLWIARRDCTTSKKAFRNALPIYTSNKALRNALPIYTRHQCHPRLYMYNHIINKLWINWRTTVQFTSTPHISSKVGKTVRLRWSGRDSWVTKARVTALLYIFFCNSYW